MGYRAFLRDLTPDQRLGHISGFLERSFGGPPPADGSADVLEVFALDWAEETFSRGSYSIFFPPGVLGMTWPTLAPIYREGRLGPQKGLWLSGADWTTDSFGYM